MQQTELDMFVRGVIFIMVAIGQLAVCQRIYTGCAYDRPEKTFKYLATNDTANMSPGLCHDLCNKENYAYMGLENGSSCYCGTWLEHALADAAPEKTCNVSCISAPSMICGGALTLSTYKIGTPKNYMYKGCYQDQWARVFPYCVFDGIFRSGPMSPGLCADLCNATGTQYPYMGVQYANQCFCGTIDQFAKATAIEESSCNATCRGVPDMLCGGTWAMGIYKIAQAGV